MPQPARSGGAAVFEPQTQEEAALDAVSRRLRGWTERLEAFAQAETEWTRDLERAVLVSPSSSCFLVILSLGGAPAHPLGVAPEVRANYVVVGLNLSRVGLVLTLVFSSAS